VNNDTGFEDYDDADEIVIIYSLIHCSWNSFRPTFTGSPSHGQESYQTVQ